MESLVGALRAATTSISRELDGLDEEVATLRSKWGGDASDAYDAAQRTNRQNLRQMTRILEGSGGATDNILIRHRAAAAAVEKLWG